MTLKEAPLWLHTTLCLSGLALAVGLHLAWHPLRRHFSDALDFMRTQRLPLMIMMSGLLLNGWLAAPQNTRALPDWPALLQGGVLEALLLPHQAFPPWPLATLLPLWVVAGAALLLRLPYRYQKEKHGPAQQILLVALALLAVSWMILEWTVPEAGRPGFLQTPMRAARMFFTALAVAGCQVWLCRMVIDWAEPANPEEGRSQDARTALHECFARWRGVLWLALFNVLVLDFTQEQWRIGETWRWFVAAELLLIFAPLPMAVATGGGSFAKAGGRMLRALWRTWPALLAWLVTAAALLALAHHAVMTVATLVGDAAGIIARALIGGVTQGWLLVAILLILYRRGFPAQDRTSAD